MSLSELWRENTSKDPGVELASVLAAAQIMAQSLVPETNVTFAGIRQAKTDRKTVYLSAADVGKEFPVAGDTVDYLLGLTVHEMGHVLFSEDKERLIGRLSKALRIYSGLGDFKYLVELVDILEDAYVDHRMTAFHGYRDYLKVAITKAIEGIPLTQVMSVLNRDVTRQEMLNAFAMAILLGAGIPNDTTIENLSRIGELSQIAMQLCSDKITRDKAIKKAWKIISLLPIQPPPKPKPEPEQEPEPKPDGQEDDKKDSNESSATQEQEQQDNKQDQAAGDEEGPADKSADSGEDNEEEADAEEKEGAEGNGDGEGETADEDKESDTEAAEAETSMGDNDGDTVDDNGRIEELGEEESTEEGSDEGGGSGDGIQDGDIDDASGDDSGQEPKAEPIDSNKIDLSQLINQDITNKKYLDPQIAEEVSDAIVEQREDLTQMISQIANASRLTIVAYTPDEDAGITQWARDKTSETEEQLRRILQDYRLRRTADYRGLRSGRVSARRLHRVGYGDDRVFQRRERPEEIDMAVCLLMDLSGSVKGSAGLIYQVVVAACDAFAKEKLEFIALGYSFSEKCFIPRLYDRETMKPLLSLTNEWSSTPSYEGLAAAIAQLLRLGGTKKKVLIHCTDGAPNSISNADFIIPQMLKEARDQGIEDIHIGVSSHYDPSKFMRLYGATIHIDDISELPNVIEEKLREKLEVV